MAVSIAVLSLKGGTGKTTTVAVTGSMPSFSRRACHSTIRLRNGSAYCGSVPVAAIGTAVVTTRSIACSAATSLTSMSTRPACLRRSSSFWRESPAPRRSSSEVVRITSAQSPPRSGGHKATTRPKIVLAALA